MNTHVATALEGGSSLAMAKWSQADGRNLSNISRWRRRFSAVLWFCLVVGGGLFGRPVHGVEPWADPRLKVTNGLALWYDASRQTAGRRALELAPLVAGQPV